MVGLNRPGSGCAYLHSDQGTLVGLPFDVAYRLGLGPRSDYDINLSSDTMFRRALARWDETRHGGHDTTGTPKVPLPPARDNHGYLNKDLVEEEFPALRQWAHLWTARLGRRMSYAVFLSGGPEHTAQRPGHAGISLHHQDTD